MKKVLCFMTMCFMIFIFHVSASADTAPLSFITNSNLPRAEANGEYSVKIEAQGGMAPYTYKLVKQLYAPPGLTLSEDGTFSGIPTVGNISYTNIKVEVTDSEGNTAQKTFRMSIYAKTVDFKVIADTFKYDTKPHSVTVVPYVDGQEASDIVNDYSITYNGSESQTNVGNYPIKIKVNEPGYIFGSLDKTHLYITQRDVDVSFEGTSFEYDGTPKTPEISVTSKISDTETVEVSHSVLYEGIGDTVYSSENPPTDIGTYRVSCSVTDNNFTAPVLNSAIFEITPVKVDFTLTGGNSSFTYGDEWNGYYSPSVDGVDYSVKYIKNETEYDKPVDAGVYSVKITLTDESKYSIGEVTPSSITVNKRQVNFTITENKKLYNGSEQYPVITNDCSFTGYLVKYIKDGKETVPKETGLYIIVIEITDNNYVLGTQSETEFLIYENKLDIILGDGNSIFAKINASGTDIENAKQNFIDTRLYNGVYYSKNAWGSVDCDIDEKALFMYNNTEYTLPSVSAHNSDGASLEVKSILKTPAGDVDITGQTSFTPQNMECGIYTIEYTANDTVSGESVSKDRYVVILPPLGDVNNDKNVNSIDGNWILKNYAQISETTDNEKLFKYRVCDVDKDGVVTVLDSEALYNRFNTKITEYYR